MADSTRDTWTQRGSRAVVGVAVGLLVGLVVKDLNLAALVSYWGPRAPLVAACAVVGGLLALTPLRKLVMLAAFALAGLWVVVAFSPLSQKLFERVTRSDPPANADAIFVFSSSLQHDGDPSPVSMTRLLHGLDLLAEGRASRLIVSELPAPEPRYTDVAKRWKARFNVAGEIVTVGPVRSTHDEGVAVGELCRKQGWTRIIAVTTPAHGKRAAAVLEHEGLHVISSPAVETRYDAERLQNPDDRLDAFCGALHELIGIALYRARGWLSPPSR